MSVYDLYFQAQDNVDRKDDWCHTISAQNMYFLTMRESAELTGNDTKDYYYNAHLSRIVGVE